MRIGVEWFPQGVDRCRERGFESLVIVDALRFSATVSLALSLGIEKVLPVRSVEEARSYRGKPGYLVAMEVGGAKQPGADIGNSPGELIELLRRGVLRERYRVMVIRTSSGAQALVRARELGFRKVYVASTVNARYFAMHILRSPPESLCILCAGRDARFFALEDMLAAGAVIDELVQHLEGAELGEEAWAAYLAWRGAREGVMDIARLVKEVGGSGKKLVSLGYENDIALALSLNTVPAVPVLRSDGYLVDALRSPSETV